ncbi:MAG TPA: CAP domain-containing protein [Actinomycetota bacterium]|nr:CAP domain-containing protein [Actinomycetota bacterium]
MQGTAATATGKRMPLDLRQQIALVIALIAALAIPIAAPFTVPDFFPTAAGDNQCYRYSSADRDFTTKMNAERKAKGLKTMKLDPELSKVAMVHTANEMIKTNTLHHTSNSALAKRVTNWVTVGENVGVGAEVSSLHQAFMNSPAHRANIMLAKFNNVGVGSKVSDGRLWVTVIFEATSNPGTSLGMPKC